MEKTIKEIVISVRISKKLNQQLINMAVAETAKKNKIIKVSDVIRELLEREL